MNTIKLKSCNENDTLKIAETMASILPKNATIILNGDLGSGKTKFVHGFLTHYGLENDISSPTFTIVNEYINENINIYHFDVYRLSDSSEFLEIGGEEYFDNGICLIEWGNIIQDVLPSEYVQIDFEKDNDDENIRFLNISLHGNKYISLFENKEDLI